MLFPVIVVVVGGLFLLGRYASKRSRMLGIVVYVLLGVVVAAIVLMFYVLEEI